MKILNITYVSAELEEVLANATQLNYEERNQLLSLIRSFEGFFNGNLRNLDTEPVDLELNPDSKPV